MKKHFILFLLPVLLLWGCQLNEKEEATTENTFMNPENYIPGVVRLKITEDYAQRLEAEKDVLFPGINASVARTFPSCGKFEERTRKAGLHLWYDVTFDHTIPITKAGEDLETVDGIDIIAYLPKMNFHSTADEGAFPFSDPLLPSQWHYHNDGTLSGSVSGADINLFEAWKYYTTGSNQVIVAVVDGGVSFHHEDLAANMWINKTELEGEQGIDDDDNGYVDDVYGFNFITNTGYITEENHGTHVAGTIGAVSNNEIGLCGIAGGDGTDQGVLIMSCQVLDKNEKWGDSAKAIKYAADNGAVICQNSWSYREYTNATKAYIEAAIDYFNTYAGMDENGNQTGPMAGGLVVFAAGNDNTDTGYPASYEGVMAVSALKHNYEKAGYSNFGEWIDIAAPGGEGSGAFPKGMVHSTLTENKYGYLMGTSMACPHVSGVAALIVSHFGGSGFTNTMLWDALIHNTKDISTYNPQYKNLLGSGLVDAYAALAGFSTTAPEPVQSIFHNVLANRITLSWLVPIDTDDGKAYSYTVYGHKAEKPDSVFTVRTYTERWRQPGDTVFAQISDLDFSTAYSLAVQAFDYAGNAAETSTYIQVTTKGNNAPIITPVDSTTITLKAHESGSLSFAVVEPDLHAFTCALTPGSDAATLSMKNDSTAVVHFHAPSASEGTYSGTLTATDAYGMSSSIPFAYTILKNNPPVVVKTIDDVYFGNLGGTKRIAIDDYFHDPDGEVLQYTFSSSNSNASATLENNMVYITGKNYGYSTITITATDGLGASCHMDVSVLVRDGRQPVDLYPNPVTDVLYVRTGTPVTVHFALTSALGSEVIHGTFNTGPFNPASIDVAGLSSGTYTVTILLEGVEHKKTIIKL
jgi:serine protease